jgi:hypothetical protein
MKTSKAIAAHSTGKKNKFENYLDYQLPTPLQLLAISKLKFRQLAI